MNNGNGNARIEALQRRAHELKLRIAAELERRRKREAREQQRLFSIVGRVVCGKAAQNPEGFGLMLRQVLDGELTDNSERAFVRQKGIL